MPKGFVCGPLVELQNDEQRYQRRLYDEIGDVFLHTTGQPACIPHDHFNQEYDLERVYSNSSVAVYKNLRYAGK